MSATSDQSHEPPAGATDAAARPLGAPHVLSPEATGWDGVRELHPAVLASRRSGGEASPAIIDVREHWEWAAVRLEGARHIPLGEFVDAVPALDRDVEYVLLCHHGVRSRAAANYLAQQGFRRVWNLSGGIDRYALEVDPSLARY